MNEITIKLDKLEASLEKTMEEVRSRPEWAQMEIEEVLMKMLALNTVLEYKIKEYNKRFPHAPLPKKVLNSLAKFT